MRSKEDRARTNGKWIKDKRGALRSVSAKQEPPKKGKSLAKLEPVDLRAYWEIEDRDFTPWLAQEENLNELARAIGLDSLELVGIEQAVGDFRADIVASDADDNVVVIENQLEQTDHEHLGKLITYASARKVTIVVWISRDLGNEHRQALDWLNHMVRGEVGFFGLEIELWKIGDSDAAPKFNVVVQPTDFEFPTTRISSRSPLVEAFWQEFPEFCRQSGSSLKLAHKVDFWGILFQLPTTGFRIRLRYRKGRFRCELRMRGTVGKQAFPQLEVQRKQIEAEISEPLTWKPPAPSGKGARVGTSRPGMIEEKEKWPEVFAWLKAQAEAFFKAFEPRVKAMKLEAGEDEDEEEP
ncbi:MAG: DUF4268 domain-containing protein [Acidobacteria bacterium]|nr:MAG: DUF4268 domain-containing protein [Acidobacteriota bacterium]